LLALTRWHSPPPPLIVLFLSLVLPALASARCAMLLTAAHACMLFKFPLTPALAPNRAPGIPSPSLPRPTEKTGPSSWSCSSPDGPRWGCFLFSASSIFVPSSLCYIRSNYINLCPGARQRQQGRRRLVHCRRWGLSVRFWCRAVVRALAWERAWPRGSAGCSSLTWQ
jgi:hypothetical protein